MQIVSEALFQKLPLPVTLYTSTHNHLAYLTAHQLVLRNLGTPAKSHNIKIKGKDIIDISLQSQHYVLVLYVQGVLQIRRSAHPNQVMARVGGLVVKQGVSRLRAAGEIIYLLGLRVQKIVLNNGQPRVQQMQLQEQQKQYGSIKNIMVSSMLQSQKITIVQFESCLCFSIEGVPLASIPVKNITNCVLLYDPLQIDDIREYLIVCQGNRWLRVFDFQSLQQILQMELFNDQKQQIQIKVDPLHQYLMIRTFDSQTKTTTRNSLLKINKNYYYQSSLLQTQSFFMFDIQIGLKQNLILFPTHLQVIHGNKFHSIDMCFFTQKEIRIATLVVDINHQTKLHHTCQFDPSWKSVIHWEEIVTNLKQRQPETVLVRDKKQIESQKKSSNTSEQWDRFMIKFLQQNLQNLKNQGFVINFDKPTDHVQKYLEYSANKPFKTQTQDALNTLSGSQSYRSLGSVTHQLQQRLLKMIQGDFSEGQLSKQKHSQASIRQALQIDSQQQSQEDKDSNLQNYQQTFKIGFMPIQEMLEGVEDRLQRVEDVHIRKLKNIQGKVRQHTKQAVKMDFNLQKWCGEEMKIMGAQIQESLKEFSVTIGKLDIASIRYLKKMKKRYRDYVYDEIQTRQEKLEEHQSSSQKISSLLRKLGSV